jgi:uncharacterized protein YecE (DUF72 family)
MPVLHVGTQLERPPGPKYLEELHFGELALPPPLPRPATLARWRKNLPTTFALALVAPRPTLVSSRGPLRFDEDLEAAVDWLGEAADALGAFALVLPTGADLTTGQRDRDLLAAYLERLPRPEGCIPVWAPSGLWEPDEAASQAQRLGVVYAVDPLESPIPEGPVGYARLRAVGGRRRFTEGMLDDTLEAVEASDNAEVYVAIESPRSFREATALQRMAQADAPGA